MQYLLIIQSERIEKSVGLLKNQGAAFHIISDLSVAIAALNQFGTPVFLRMVIDKSHDLGVVLVTDDDSRESALKGIELGTSWLKGEKVQL